MRLPVAKDGYPIIIIPLILGILFIEIEWVQTGIFLLIISVFFILFFRDPDRTIPGDPDIIVAPADGTVVSMAKSPRKSDEAEGYCRISIFMSLLNVHVNRAPFHGKISDIQYLKGKFLPAFKETATFFNEQNTLTIEDQSLGTFKVTQIAGILARRIVCSKQVGDQVEKGERIGLIKFGSRVDVYLPPGVDILVEKGDGVKGGSTPIAKFKYQVSKIKIQN
jgi:phosphatidylserine decarboxylase